MNQQEFDKYILNYLLETLSKTERQAKFVAFRLALYDLDIENKSPTEEQIKSFWGKFYEEYENYCKTIIELYEKGEEYED